MKKFLLLLLGLTLANAVAAAETAPFKSYRYVGYKMHKNADLAVKMSSNVGESGEMKDSSYGLGVNFGAKPSKYYRSELEASLGAAMVEKDITPPATFYKSYVGGVLANMYFENEVMNGFSPYLGMGVGFGMIHTEIVDRAYSVDISKTTYPIVMQFMAGANFAVSESVNLDVGIKYKDYGRQTISPVPNSPARIYLDIDTIEIYAGFAWKFQL